jgi:hypothetical protein
LDIFLRHQALSITMKKFLILSMALASALAGAWAQQPPWSEQTGDAKAADEKQTTTAEKERTATFLREHRNDFAFFRSKQGSGSGFIANMRGHKVLITNTHVVAALKGATVELLDRSPLHLGTASVAVGHDLMAFVVIEGGTGIPLASAVETEATIGDPVVVLGNADGGGVVNPLQGELVGIGPDRIEVSAPFELGNSGSPIIDLRNGEVIGVATYAKLDTLLSGKEKLRRFGYRLDSTKTWQLVDWGRFFHEDELASKILTATFELNDILTDFDGVRTRKVSGAFETLELRSALEAYYNAAAQGTGNVEATRMLLASLREACQSDLSAARGLLTYDYFQRQLDANQIVRGRLLELIDKVLQP